MQTYLIPKKESNTGSIHDIASDIEDRKVYFLRGTKYAVVLSYYYGDVINTSHFTEEAAILKSRQLSKLGFSHKIIDTEGNIMVINSYNQLERADY